MRTPVEIVGGSGRFDAIGQLAAEGGGVFVCLPGQHFFEIGR